MLQKEKWAFQDKQEQVQCFHSKRAKKRGNEIIWAGMCPLREREKGDDAADVWTVHKIKSLNELLYPADHWCNSNSVSNFLYPSSE